MREQDDQDGTVGYVSLEHGNSTKTNLPFWSALRRIPLVAILLSAAVLVLAACVHHRSSSCNTDSEVGSSSGHYTYKQTVTLQGDHVKYNFVFFNGANSPWLPDGYDQCTLPPAAYQEWNYTIPDVCPDEYEDAAAYQANEAHPYQAGACDGDVLSCALKAAQDSTTALNIDNSLSRDRTHIFAKVRVCVRPGAVCLPYGPVKIKPNSFYTMTAINGNAKSMLSPSEEGMGILHPNNYVRLDESKDVTDRAYAAKVKNHWRFVNDETHCVDKNSNCANWAASGECQNNPEYMLDQCGKSCDRCINYKAQNRGNGQWLKSEWRSKANYWYSRFGGFDGGSGQSAGISFRIPATCDKYGLIPHIDDHEGGSFRISSEPQGYLAFDDHQISHIRDSACGGSCHSGEEQVGEPRCCAITLCIQKYLRCRSIETKPTNHLKFIIQEIRWEERNDSPSKDLVGVSTMDYNDWAVHNIKIQLFAQYGADLTNFLREKGTNYVRRYLYPNTNWATDLSRSFLSVSESSDSLIVSESSSLALRRSMSSIGSLEAGASRGFSRGIRTATEGLSFLPVIGLAFGVVAALWTARDSAATDFALATLQSEIEQVVEELQQEIQIAQVDTIATSIRNVLNANMDILNTEVERLRQGVFKSYQTGNVQCYSGYAVDDLLTDDDYFRRHLEALLQLINFQANIYGETVELAYKKLALPILKIGAMEYVAMAVDRAALSGFFAEFIKNCGDHTAVAQTCSDIVYLLNVQDRAQDFEHKARSWSEAVIADRKEKLKAHDDKRQVQTCNSDSNPPMCTYTHERTYKIRDEAIDVDLLSLYGFGDGDELVAHGPPAYAHKVMEQYRDMLEWSLRNSGRTNVTEFSEAMNLTAQTALTKCEELYERPENHDKRLEYVQNEVHIEHNMYHAYGNECSLLSDDTELHQLTNETVVFTNETVVVE